MGDDKAAVEHPLVDFVEQQLRESLLAHVKSSNGRDRPTPSSTEIFFAPSQCRPGRPFNWLTTSPYPLSRSYPTKPLARSAPIKLAEDFSHQEAVTWKYLH